MNNIRQMIAHFEKNELSVYETCAPAAASRRTDRKNHRAGALAFLAVALLFVSNSYSFVMVRRQLVKLEGVETRISSIIENILDGMITVDEAGIICSMNPAAEKMFGCRDNEMVGHNFTRLVPKRTRTEHDSKPIACAWNEMVKRTGSTTLALGRHA